MTDCNMNDMLALGKTTPETSTNKLVSGLIYIEAMTNLLDKLRTPVPTSMAATKERLKEVLMAYSKAVPAAVYFACQQDPELQITDRAREAAAEISSDAQLQTLLGHSLATKDWKIPLLMFLAWVESKIQLIPTELKMAEIVTAQTETLLEGVTEITRDMEAKNEKRS